MASLALGLCAIEIEALQKKIAFYTAIIQGAIPVSADDMEMVSSWLYSTLMEMEAKCRQMNKVLLPE
jgi:hypothetical protein